MSDMDRHIQQTIDRLQCIRQHLSSPQGFQNAARELLEWCSDPRAFQQPFENGLISCLTVVSRVATQPGFDLELGYRLLAICAAHREKFSSKSAAMLSVWCEELGRLLLLRHQKNRDPNSTKSPPNMHSLQKNMPPGVIPTPDGNGGWAMTGPGQPGPGAHQSLSVVTTVWGVTPTTQTVPFRHTAPGGYTNTTMSATPYTQQAPQGYGPGSQIQQKAAGYASSPQSIPHGMQYRRDSAPAYAQPNYPPTPNTPGSNQTITSPNDYQAPPGALSAAAFVAAAATATATATATASMVAIQEQQNQQQMNMNMGMNGQYGQQMPPGQHYNSQYGMAPQQRPPGPMGMAQGPGPMPTKPGMAGMYPNQRRPAPYPHPQHMMVHKRQQQQQPQQQQQYPNGTQYMPQPGYGPVPMGQQYPGKPQYPPNQQPMPSPTYGPPTQHGGQPPPQAQMRHAAPMAYGAGQNPYMVPTQYAAQRQPPQGPPNYGPMNNQQSFPPNMSYQHSPLPGNPTPPITPGSTMPPYMAPAGDIKPNFQEFKPQMPMKRDPDELRLTFPVRDGDVLPPFRLQHNLAVSNHVFHLRSNVYQTLMWRCDLELQLKCFHHEDRQMNTNWPASVTVSVNAKPLDIERGENKTSHKPLYLKEVCQPGQNKIQITVTACCCSHLFVLQLVHRPSVKSVLHGLLKKRLLPAEHCIPKIKRNFTSAMPNNQLNGEDGVEQTAIKVSLKCPITFRRITLPARGHDCKHIQCFDLESYLQLNCERGSWRCPVCNKTALLEGLEIDQYIWAILTNLSSTEFEEVTIEPTASWKPVSMKLNNGIKEEENDACGHNARWMKVMSPSSMTMPTMNTMGDPPQPSPYSGGPFNNSYPGSPPEGPPPGSYGPGDFPSGPPLSHMGDSMVPVDMKPMLMGPGPGPGMGPGSGQVPYPSPVSQSDMMAQRSPATLDQIKSPVSLDQMGLVNPLTPGSQGPGSVPPPPSLSHSNGLTGSQQPLSHHNQSISSPDGSGQLIAPPSLADSAVADLNFDPAAIIDGDTQNPSLDLLPDNIGDPMELLSYLGPTDGTGDGTGNNSNNANSTSDDLLALFES